MVIATLLVGVPLAVLGFTTTNTSVMIYFVAIAITGIAESFRAVSITPAAQATLEQKELAAAIDRFLRTLPEKDCNLFLRRYWYVDSISVIADRYGMKENTVKSILFRTREKLRKFLGE